MSETKKALGQHWLKDEAILQEIVDASEITAGEHVLEIGPGLGTLTSKIADAGADVIALEFDQDLIKGLNIRFINTSQVKKDINKSVGVTIRKHRIAVFLSVVKLSLHSIFKRVDAFKVSLLFPYRTFRSDNNRAACAANKLQIVFSEALNLIIKLAVRMST